MVVKEFLQTKGVDVAKFTGARKNAQPVTRSTPQPNVWW